MPRHLDSQEPCRELGEEQRGDRQGRRGGEDQGARAERAFERSERDDGVSGSAGAKW